MSTLSLKNRSGIAFIALVFLTGALIFFSLSHAALGAEEAASTAKNAGNDTVNLLSCSLESGSLFTCLVSGTAWLLNAFVGFLISLAAWLVTIMLQFNSTILNSPAVRAGFSATISLANLGFVLAVIVIAIATILRQQTYGVKQLLWKVVVMAIVVNFGLIFAGALISFSDGLTAYFIKASAQEGSEPSFGNFVTNLTTAFQPQALTSQTPATSASDFSAKLSKGVLRGLLQGALGPLGVLQAPFFSGSAASDPNIFMQSILSALFSVVFSLIILFIFITLAVMLAVRYTYITILLILLPLAWMSWVFPPLRKHWSEWWQKFVQWVFFPPVVVFFLYLALFISFNQKNYVDENIAGSGAKDQTIGLLGALGRSGPDLLNAMLGMNVVLALAIGGIFAANKMGIELAGASMKVGGELKNWAIGATGRAAGRRAGRAYEASGLQKRVDQMAGSKNFVTAGLGRVLQRQAGKVRKASEKDFTSIFENQSPTEIAAALKGVFSPFEDDNVRFQAKAIERLRKEGALSLVMGEGAIGGQSIEAWQMKNNSRLVENFGGFSSMRALDVAIGGDKGVNDARMKYAAAEKSGNETEMVRSFDALENSIKAFVKTMSKEEASNMGKTVSETLKKEGVVFRELFAKTVMDSPLSASMLSKMKGGDPEALIFSPYRGEISRREAEFKKKQDGLFGAGSDLAAIESENIKRKEQLAGMPPGADRDQVARAVDDVEKKLGSIVGEKEKIEASKVRLDRMVTQNVYSEGYSAPQQVSSSAPPPPGGKK
ncbi:MAG: hypothetical protein AAB495_02260 [Patescibacteria group bacterium]